MLLEGTRNLTYATANITTALLELGLALPINDTINKGLALINDASTTIVAASESIEAVRTLL